jgi:hypothetical protein
MATATGQLFMHMHALLRLAREQRLHLVLSPAKEKSHVAYLAMGLAKLRRHRGTHAVAAPLITVRPSSCLQVHRPTSRPLVCTRVRVRVWHGSRLSRVGLGVALPRDGLQRRAAVRPQLQPQQPSHLVVRLACVCTACACGYGVCVWVDGPEGIAGSAAQTAPASSPARALLAARVRGCATSGVSGGHTLRRQGPCPARPRRCTPRAKHPHALEPRTQRVIHSGPQLHVAAHASDQHLRRAGTRASMLALDSEQVRRSTHPTHPHTRYSTTTICTRAAACKEPEHPASKPRLGLTSSSWPPDTTP